MICGCPKNRGLTEPHLWDGSKELKFCIHGRLDADYVANTDEKRSISGGRLSFGNCPISFKSATQRSVTLSKIVAKSAVGVMLVHNILYTYRVLKSFGLSLELPTLFKMVNKGVVDLAKNWIFG